MVKSTMIADEIVPLFGEGEVGIVNIPSSGITFYDTEHVALGTKYAYLEIIYTHASEKEKIVSALQKLQSSLEQEMLLGLDVIFIQLNTDGFMPNSERE